MRTTVVDPNKLKTRRVLKKIVEIKAYIYVFTHELLVTPTPHLHK